MFSIKNTIHRFLELLMGDRVDKLEVAYAQSGPEERAEARNRFVAEKAKHRIASAATAVVVAIFSLIVERMLPEA
jgi:hypothetical protein